MSSQNKIRENFLASKMYDVKISCEQLNDIIKKHAKNSKWEITFYDIDYQKVSSKVFANLDVNKMFNTISQEYEIIATSINRTSLKDFSFSIHTFVNICNVKLVENDNIDEAAFLEDLQSVGSIEIL